MRGLRITLLAVVGIAGAFGPVSAANAATRYAAPAGTGPEPCAAASPCDIDRAVESAPSGDDVVLAAGDYHPAGGTPFTGCAALPPNQIVGALQVPTGVAVQGADSGPRPRIITDSTPCVTLEAVNSTIRYLDVESGRLGIFSGGSSLDLDRLYVNATGGNPAVQTTAGLVRNSVLKTSFIAVPAVLARGGVSVVNDTAVGKVEAGSGGAITATNVITTVSFSANAGTIAFDHSIAPAGCSATSGGTCSPGAGNQTSAPKFVDAAGGNYHEAADSLSRDAGIAEPAAGSFDYDGGARANGVTDIGADEYGSPPPSPTTGAVTDVTQTTATVNGTVNPWGQSTGAFFEYGPSPSFGAQTPQSDVGSDFSDHAVSATLVGLAPGTTYYYRLTASTGGTHGATASFTTASPPPPGSGGGPPAEQPAPPSQPTAPTLESAGGKPAATQQGSSVVVDTRETAKCPAGGPDCAVTTTATATVPTSALRIAAKRRTKSVKVASGRIKVSAGMSKRIKVKLNKTGVRLLRKLKKLSVTIKVSVRAGTGSPAVRSQKVTLRQPKKRRR